MSQVPRYKERLQSMVTKHTFALRHDSTRQRLQLMDDAVCQIKGDTLFQQLLGIVLALGNYMNGNSIAGGAFGFRLTSLPLVCSSHSLCVPHSRVLTLGMMMVDDGLSLSN